MFSYAKMLKRFNSVAEFPDKKSFTNYSSVTTEWNDYIIGGFVRDKKPLSELLTPIPEKKRYAFLAEYIPTLNKKDLEQFRDDMHKVYAILPDEHHVNFFNLMNGLEARSSRHEALPDITPPSVDNIKMRIAKEKIEDRVEDKFENFQEEENRNSDIEFAIASARIRRW